MKNKKRKLCSRTYNSVKGQLFLIALTYILSDSAALVENCDPASLRRSTFDNFLSHNRACKFRELFTVCFQHREETQYGNKSCSGMDRYVFQKYLQQHIECSH